MVNSTFPWLIDHRGPWKDPTPNKRDAITANMYSFLRKLHSYTVYSNQNTPSSYSGQSCSVLSGQSELARCRTANKLCSHIKRTAIT